jgi:hypothetical protein
MGLVRPDGVRIAANPDEPPRLKMLKLTEGPVPSSDGKLLKVPKDVAGLVYRWMVSQATARAEDVVSHVRTGSPSVERMAFVYQVPFKTVERWVRDSLEKVGGKRSRIGEVLDKLPKLERFEPKKIAIPKGVTYFISGSQGSPGEIEGAARLAERKTGFGLGIDINECTDRCMVAMAHTAGRGVKVFVDSGAFTEFQCYDRARKAGWPGRRAREACEIVDEEWERRLSDYQEIARLHRSNTYLVAPDKIGSQKETEARLRSHVTKLKKSVNTYKANLLLVAQEGATPRATFWKRMRALLVKKGIPEKKIVLAVPMKARPASISEVKDLAKIPGVWAMHLLGMGPAKAGQYIKAVRQVAPKIKVFTDSVLITSGARRGFLSVNPEHYTYAQDIVRYPVMAEAFEKSREGYEFMVGWVDEHGWGKRPVPDYTEQIYEDASSWMNRDFRRVLASELERMSREGLLHPRPKQPSLKLLIKDPSEWLGSGMHGDDEAPYWGDHPVVSAWFDDAWCRFLGSYFSARVKRDAVVMAYKRGDLAAIRRETPGAEAGVEAIFPGPLARKRRATKKVAKKKVAKKSPAKPRKKRSSFRHGGVTMPWKR